MDSSTLLAEEAFDREKIVSNYRKSTADARAIALSLPRVEDIAASALSRPLDRPTLITVAAIVATLGLTQSGRLETADHSDDQALFYSGGLSGVHRVTQILDFLIDFNDQE